MGHAIFVFGPAGTGKTTFVQNMFEYGQAIGRRFSRVNLDPAQKTDYEFDITEYITVDEIMEALDYGPNGGLVYALREFADNFRDIEELCDLLHAEEYLLIDCPGQIELFAHSDEMIEIVENFKQFHKCCIVYLIEAQYVFDTGKYLAACLNAMVCMLRFNVPHINVITKLDMLEDDAFENELDDKMMFIYPSHELLSFLKGNPRFVKFSETILEVLESNNMVSFSVVNWEKEDMLQSLLYSIDDSIQFHDDREVKELIK